MKRVNALKAINVIKILKEGIDNNDKKEILRAYDLIEKDKAFSWDDLDDLFENWNTLVDEANDLLLEE